MTIAGRGTSRAATDELLAGLRADRYTPAGWMRFLARSAARSAEQAAQRPRALTEVATLHAVLALLIGRHRAAHVLPSLTLSVTHLGLLEDQRTLGPANPLSLLRAHLPLIASAPNGRVALIAATTDILDGALARRYATSPFGYYADSFADAAFWTWFAARHEARPELRLLSIATWTAPIATVLVASLARGKMLQVRRHPWLRPAVAMQLLLIFRSLRH